MTPETALSLLGIALGAFIAPLVAHRLGIPTAVGEILFGMLAGAHLAGIVAEDAIVGFLSELGFIFLMFLAGLEIDFDAIERDARSRRLGIVSAVIVLGVAAALTWSTGHGFLLTLVLTAGGIGILIPTLREAGLLKERFGQALLIFGTIAEVMTLCLFTLFEAWAAHGLSPRMISGVVKLAIVIGAGVLLLKVLVLLAWWLPERFVLLSRRHRSIEIGLRGAFALLFSLVALASLLHVKPIVGAFLAGAVLRYVFREVHALEGKIAGAGYGFFIPVFFITVGLRFDVTGLVKGQVLLPALLLVLGIVALRFLYIPFLLPFAGRRRVASGALLLGCPLTILVAIAEMAHRAGAVDRAQESAIVLAAIVTAILLPALFKMTTGPRPVEAAT